MSYKKASFVISCAEVAGRPKDGKPCVLLIGRSNVGKSTLINALCASRLAFASKKAGKTKLLNYFLIEERFYLVDAPGYGSTSFATKDTMHFSKMMEEYLPLPEVKAVALLMDLRRPLGEDDKAFLKYLQKSGKPLLIVATKTDKMNQSEKAKAKAYLKEVGIDTYLESDLTPAKTNKIAELIARYAK